MDNPTRIGLGGTAVGTLAALGQPLFGWYVSGPIMLVCATVAVWGFWPIIRKCYGRQKAASLKEIDTSQRISLLELLSEAAAKGWVFNRDTLQAFTHALRQAANEGGVVIWGILKNGRDPISAPSLYVSEKIAASYFKEHWIDAHQGWVHNNNRYMATSLPSGNPSNSYSDLHVEREPALKWLGRNAK